MGHFEESVKSESLFSLFSDLKSTNAPVEDVVLLVDIGEMYSAIIKDPVFKDRFQVRLVIKATDTEKAYMMETSLKSNVDYFDAVATANLLAQ